MLQHTGRVQESYTLFRHDQKAGVPQGLAYNSRRTMKQQSEHCRTGMTRAY